MRTLALALPLLLFACDKKDEKAGSGGMPSAPATSADRAKDPICGMMVDKATSLKATHEGANYYFCAEECVKQFKADPKKHAVSCACAKTAKRCDCGHCGTKGETCDCN